MEKLLHERIAAYAALNPSKTALQDAQGEMSYGQLEATSASLARELVARGAGQGDAVAVYTTSEMPAIISIIQLTCSFLMSV